MSEPVACTSADGLALEAQVDDADKPRAAAVVCHPHPKMGGTMNAPLLAALTESLTARGFSVLRFNFRGTGDSEGSASNGIAEVADAAGAVDLARARWEELPCVLVGWSFGGAVAIRLAAEDDSLAACVAITPAVEEKEDVTAGLPAPDSLEIDIPLLVVCALNDEVVSPEACRSWAQEARADLVEVSGANHFFWGKYEALAGIVGGWLERAV
jgi:alpha/beta superfamily hydrolase